MATTEIILKYNGSLIIKDLFIVFKIMSLKRIYTDPFMNQTM